VTQPRFELGHPNTSLQRYRYTLDRHVIGILKLGDLGPFQNSPSESIESSKKIGIELAGKTIRTTCASKSILHFYRYIILLDLFNINRAVLRTVRDEAV